MRLSPPLRSASLIEISQAPETIYTRPASRTVAAFVGMPNLLTATARELLREGDATLAGVVGDGWEGWCSTGDGVRAGEKLTVIVRPEVIQLVRGAGARPGKGIAWTGVVRQRFFRGDAQPLHRGGRIASVQRGRAA